MDIAYFSSPIGTIEVTGDADGIASINFLDIEKEATENISEPLQKCVGQLEEYFEGSRSQFNVTLNPQGTDFQKRVWNKLLEIPFNKTVSYQEMANRLGDPKVIRAAASANGKNPISIIIPCHRVIGSDGSLTGYGGGLHRKKWLLAHENPVKQQSLFS